jgi:hypothetical protein
MTKNILIQVSEEEHRRIKTLAATLGVTIKQLMLETLAETRNLDLRSIQMEDKNDTGRVY